MSYVTTSQNVVQSNVKGLPEACVFVSSLSPKTTEEGLHKYFEQFFGKVLKTTIIRDEQHTAKPYGFVQFQELSSAKASVSCKDTLFLDGYRLRVQKAKVNSTLYLTQIPKTTTSMELRTLCEAYGKVESVTIIKERGTQESKGSAFVKFVYREDSLDALLGLKENYPLWTVEWAKSTKNTTSDVDRKAVYIGGLVPFRITEQLLREKFGRFGEMESLSLVNPLAKSGASAEGTEDSTRSAYAFIRYHSADAAFRAIETESGTEWMGKRIRVQHPDSANTKREKEIKKNQSKTESAHIGSPAGSNTDADSSTTTSPGTNVGNGGTVPYYYIPYPVPYPYPPGTNVPANSLSTSPPSHTTAPVSSLPPPVTNLQAKPDHLTGLIPPSPQLQSSLIQPPTYITPPSGYAPNNNGGQSSSQPTYYPYPGWLYAGTAAPTYPQ